MVVAIYFSEGGVEEWGGETFEYRERGPGGGMDGGEGGERSGKLGFWGGRKDVCRIVLCEQ